MTRVLIVILNWNGIEDTEKCVPSLLAQTYKNYKILIVDNGSTDNSIERINTLKQSSPKNIEVISNNVNLGFAGGVNTGITYALEHNYDAVALFNNDAVADPSWLSSLVTTLESNKGAGIATGLLLHEDGNTIDSTGDFYSTWGIAFPRGRGQTSKDIPKPGEVFGATGGASLYSTKMLKEIGSFDSTFFAYYEDADISFRAQLAGYKVVYTNKAVAYHKQGATSNKIPGFTTYQTFKNLPLLFWKNVPAALIPVIGIRFILLYILIFLNAIKNGSGWPALKGLFASIGYFWASALWKRFTIQRNKKVSTKYIWSILYHDLPLDQTGMRKFRKMFTGKS